MNRVTIQPPQLHVGQQIILDNPARFKVATCGRRFGKTVIGTYWLAGSPGSAVDGFPVAYFAPTYKLLLDVWATLKYMLKPLIKRANQTEMRIDLVTGGKIDFWTLEDKDAGRGRKYARIVIDEAAHARYLNEVWERAISPTLTDLEGDAWFISTPRGMNFFYDLYMRGDNPAYLEWASFQMPTTTNTFIPHCDIELARREMPELIFRQEYLAEFVTFGAGMVKPEHILTGEPRTKLPVVLGVDLAISSKEGADFTSIVAMSRDPLTGIVYVLEAERHRCGFNEVLNKINAAAVRHSPMLIAIEQAQYQAAVVQELSRTTKLPVQGIRPDKDKVTRFMPMITRYEQGMVRHHPSQIPAWFRDEVLAFPEGKHDDGVDAMSYAFMALPSTQSGTLKTIDKHMSGW